MRTNLELLDWLSVEQALALLQRLADPHMNAEDLAKHCVQGNCSIYIRATNIKGIYPDAFSDPSRYNSEDPEDPEDPEDLKNRLGEVYGIGYQQILNPENLHNCSSKFSAVLYGNVHEIVNCDPEAETTGVEWNAEIDLSRHPLQLKQSEIQHLANKINKTSNKSTNEGPSRKALLMTIGALLEQLLSDPKTRNLNQKAIAEKINTKYSDKRGMGITNLQNIFAAANQELRSEE